MLDDHEPHLVWPEDQAWCLACEVDEEVEFTVDVPSPPPKLWLEPCLAPSGGLGTETRHRCTATPPSVPYPLSGYEGAAEARSKNHGAGNRRLAWQGCRYSGMSFQMSTAQRH